MSYFGILMSVADVVEEYVRRRPYVQEALRRDIVNYSALARQIGEEVEGSFEAIKVALRRLREEMVAEREAKLADVSDVLEGTTVEVKGGVVVCRSDEPVDAPVRARTASGWTAVLEDGSRCGGQVVDDQVLITLSSPADLAGTPGVVSYVLSVLEGRGINVTELISCREDTHLVVAGDNAPEAFELLNERVG